MVQILDAPERKKTFAQKLNIGVGRGLEMAEGIMQTREKEEKEKKASKLIADYAAGKVKRQDLPLEQQKAILDAELKANIEATKQKAKYENQLNLIRESGLSDIFGLEEEPSQSPSSPQPTQQNRPRGIFSDEFGGAEPHQMNGRVQPQVEFQEEPEEEPARPKQKKMIPPDVIAKMSMINPAVADKLQKHNDNILAEQRHQQNLSQQKELTEKKLGQQKKLAKQKSTETKQNALRQETLPYRTELANRSEIARRGIEDKEKLLDLIETGDLDDPTVATILEALPFNVGKRFMSPATIEYKGGLVRGYGDLKNIFSGATRIKEIELLENKIADIYLTDEQKKRVLRSMSDSLKADIVKADVAAELEAEGKNY